VKFKEKLDKLHEALYGNAKLLYAYHEGGKDDQIMVDVRYEGKKYSGYLPRAPR